MALTVLKTFICKNNGFNSEAEMISDVIWQVESKEILEKIREKAQKVLLNRLVKQKKYEDLKSVDVQFLYTENISKYPKALKEHPDPTFKYRTQHNYRT